MTAARDPAVDIDVKGRCRKATASRSARRARRFHPDWGGRPTAWTAGTGTAQHLTPVIMVFLLLVLPVGIADVGHRESPCGGCSSVLSGLPPGE